MKLSAYLGQIVVVEFWFQTCSPCVASLPRLEEVKAQYGTSGLVIIIVVLDRDPSGPKEFFSGSEYDAFIVVHESDNARPTRTAYGVTGTPHASLVDRSGVIRFSGKPNDPNCVRRRQMTLDGLAARHRLPENRLRSRAG